MHGPEIKREYFRKDSITRKIGPKSTKKLKVLLPVVLLNNRQAVYKVNFFKVTIFDIFVKFEIFKIWTAWEKVATPEELATHMEDRDMVIKEIKSALRVKSDEAEQQKEHRVVTAVFLLF